MRSGQSMVSRSIGNLLESKLEDDEQDEMEIYTLENQLDEIKGQLS